MSSSLYQTILTSLKETASAKEAASRNAYFKGVVKFHGLTGPQYTSIAKVHTPAVRSLLEAQGRPAFYDLFTTLMKTDYQEEKSVATNLMRDVLNKKPFSLNSADLEFLGKDVFDAQLAYDWGTVDTLCGKVIHFILVNDGNNSNSPVNQTLLQWARQTDLPWKQRASCVAYVKLAKHGNHTDIIMEIAQSCISNQHRFVQLGCGWMLREAYLADPQRVVRFITDNYNDFTREGLRYAIEKMDKTLQQTLLKWDPTKKTPIKITAPQKEATKKRKQAPLEDHDFEEAQPVTKRSKTKAL
jgi:3-methyladenine DNA glycosylase AlkD